MAIGEVIKKSRLKKNIKQADIAKEIGVTVQTYIKWEANQTEPRASQINKLSKILELPTSAICAGEDSKKMDLIDFIIMFSKFDEHIDKHQLILSIWENVENDEKLMESMIKNMTEGAIFVPEGTVFNKKTGRLEYNKPTEKEQQAMSYLALS